MFDRLFTRWDEIKDCGQFFSEKISYLQFGGKGKQDLQFSTLLGFQVWIVGKPNSIFLSGPIRQPMLESETGSLIVG